MCNIILYLYGNFNVFLDFLAYIIIIFLILTQEGIRTFTHFNNHHQELLIIYITSVYKMTLSLYYIHTQDLTEGYLKSLIFYVL